MVRHALRAVCAYTHVYFYIYVRKNKTVKASFYLMRKDRTGHLELTWEKNFKKITFNLIFSFLFVLFFLFLVFNLILSHRRSYCVHCKFGRYIWRWRRCCRVGNHLWLRIKWKSFYKIDEKTSTNMYNPPKCFFFILSFAYKYKSFFNNRFCSSPFILMLNHFRQTMARFEKSQFRAFGNRNCVMMARVYIRWLGSFVTDDQVI